MSMMLKHEEERLKRFFQNQGVNDQNSFSGSDEEQGVEDDMELAIKLSME